jgi:hypothetical protein
VISVKKELGVDYPQLSDSETTPLAIWYEQNQGDVSEFEIFALHELIYLHYLLCSLKIYQNHEK